MLGKENVNDVKKQMEERSHAVNALVDIMLESDMPEWIKIDLRIMKEYRNLQKMIEELLVERYVIKEATPEDYEVKKTVLEDMLMMEVGIKQFVESTTMQK